MKHIITTIVMAGLFSLGFQNSSCTNRQKEKRETTLSTANQKPDSNDKMTYNFESPDRVWTMHRSLRELSGISFSDSNQLACINDEKGEIYIYDLQKEDIVSKISFAKNGDFEDIAVDGATAYIMRSDGRIFIANDFQGTVSTEEIQTSLNKFNNTEGLFLDKPNNRLLIACKFDAGNNLSSDTRAIYQFSLVTKTLTKEPLFTIDIKRVKKVLGEKTKFAPSAIAINPIDNNYYILSAEGKLLVISDGNGNVKKVHRFNNPLFIQPEGITFSANGDMYISNEGKSDKANILLFKYQKN